MSTALVIALVIIAIVAAVTVVATGGILSVKPAYANDPGSNTCSAGVCPGASGFSPPALAQVLGVPANAVAPGHSPNLPPGIAFRAPQ